MNKMSPCLSPGQKVSEKGTHLLAWGHTAEELTLRRDLSKFWSMSRRASPGRCWKGNNLGKDLGSRWGRGSMLSSRKVSDYRGQCEWREAGYVMKPTVVASQRHQECGSRPHLQMQMWAIDTYEIFRKQCIKYFFILITDSWNTPLHGALAPVRLTLRPLGNQRVLSKGITWLVALSLLWWLRQ